MTIIDPTTNLGKLRLKLGDWGDIVTLPDSVYLQTLADNDDDLQKSTVTLGSYLLGIYSSRTHEKLGLQLESWSGEQFTQFKQYLMMLIKDPSFSNIAPIPYSSTSAFNPIIDFQENWTKNYTQGTESQTLARNADISPNDGSRTGLE